MHSTSRLARARDGWWIIRRTILKKDILLAIVVAAAIVVIGTSLGWENNKVVTINPDPSAHYLQEPTNPLRFLSDWDGPIYLQIAHHGYTDLSQAGFFPFYPLLIRSINFLTNSLLDSALIVSWVSLALATFFYIKIIKHLYRVNNSIEALRAVLFFLLFPTAVVLIATYTESLFAFLSLGAIYYALQKKCLPAALFTMFATATHSNGLFVLVFVALLLAEQRVRVKKILTTVTIGCLGLLSYMIFLWKKFNNPFEFVKSQETNGWLHQNYLHHLVSSFGLLDMLGLVLVTSAVIYWWKRRRSFSIYSLLYLCIPLLGGQFSGFDRYVLMAFPFQFMLYERFRRNRTAYSICIVLFAIFWCYFLLQYAGGYTGAGG